MAVLDVLNAAMTAVFDALLYPFRSLPWAGMIFVSLVTGVLMLLVFRFTSNQDGIRRSKDLLKAGFLELWLYRNEFRSTLAAMARILGNNFRYMKHALVPLAVMLVPVVLVLVQLDARYGRRGLRSGESAILTATTDGSVALDSVALQAPPEVTVETPPLRIANMSEVDWRVSAKAPGRHRLEVRIGDRSEIKELVAGEGLLRIASKRGSTAETVLANPAERSLRAPFKSLDVTYPSAKLSLFGFRMHWLIPFFALSIALGFGLKGLFGVEI